MAHLKNSKKLAFTALGLSYDSSDAHNQLHAQS